MNDKKTMPISNGYHPTTGKDQPKVNAYTCANGCPNTVVKHRDPGVTPMYIECYNCNTLAASHFYKVPQDLEPHLIAFKPKDKAEWKMYRRYVADCWQLSKPGWTMNELWEAMNACKQHINRGGVLMVPKDKISL